MKDTVEDKIKAELAFKIHIILEMRFGDGTGEQNLQIKLASQELLGLLLSQHQLDMEKFKEALGEMEKVNEKQ